jgi:hypothetical protein
MEESPPYKEFCCKNDDMMIMALSDEHGMLFLPTKMLCSVYHNN